MNSPKDCVEITLLQAGVVINSLNGEGADREVELWDGIRATEHFPPIHGSAGYVLTLRKPVADDSPEASHAAQSIQTQVANAKKALRAALKALGHVWHFSGGSLLITENVDLARTDLVSSNAEEVEAELMSRRGLTTVSSICAGQMMALAGYSGLPLERATALAYAARNNKVLSELFENYYLARTDGTGAWFTPLYRVRDSLGHLLGSAHNAQSQLGISKTEWDKFHQLNPGRRHAALNQPVPVIGKREAANLKFLAHQWIQKYLRFTNLWEASLRADVTCSTRRE